MSATANNREQQVRENMERVYRILGNATGYTQINIVQRTGLSTDKVRTALSRLATEGWIVRGSSGWQRALTPIMQQLLYSPPPLGRQLDTEHFQ